MRRSVIALAPAVLLAGPAALAFASGGYYAEARLIACFAAWGVVLAATFAVARPLPCAVAGRVALAALVLLTGWTAASLAWAPLGGPALESVNRALLYLGTMIASIAVFRAERPARAAEPVLALGTAVVIGYGLAGRLLPGLLDIDRSQLAGGRLEQPLTYWNAEGALAAMGLVLCARIAGDGARHVAVRASATAACAPLGAGLYLTYSRGAMAAGAFGFLLLLAAAPTWRQLRAVLGALLIAAVAAAASAAFPGVASVSGSAAERQSDGAITMGILLALMFGAALATRAAAAREQEGRAGIGQIGRARHLTTAAIVAFAITLAGLIAGGLAERGHPPRLAERGGASRLSSVTSRRYDYWRIGLGAFADHPWRGTGAGGFRVVWLRERPVREGALHAHSLPLETALELGLPGVLLLMVFFGGVGIAARRAVRRRPVLAPGPIAACCVWAVHSTIDWDWQLPAVTLPAVVLAGLLVAASDAEPDGPPSTSRTAAADWAARPESRPARPTVGDAPAPTTRG